MTKKKSDRERTRLENGATETERDARTHAPEGAPEGAEGEALARASELPGAPSAPPEGAEGAEDGSAESGAEGAPEGAEGGAEPRACLPSFDLSGLTSNARDLIFEAAYLEARERGFSDREARSVAEDICDRLRLDAFPDAHRSEVSVAFFDLREEQDFIYPGGKNKARTIDRDKRVPFRRKPEDIDAIVIHQTACEFGVSQRAIRLAGDVELARARRALDVACHALAFRNGYFVAAHDLDIHVNHANRLNDRSLALEVEGRYPGLMDDPDTMAREDLQTTWGGPPTHLTDQTVECACEALRWLVEEGRKQGMPIQYIFAHRQSSDNRRSDPGEELWQRIVLDFAVPVLGLKTVPNTVWKQGYGIPKQWDPQGKGDY